MITKEFEEIYREYYSPVYAFLLRLTGGGRACFGRTRAGNILPGISFYSPVPGKMRVFYMALPDREKQLF